MPAILGDLLNRLLGKPDFKEQIEKKRGAEIDAQAEPIPVKFRGQRRFSSGNALATGLCPIWA